MFKIPKGAQRLRNIDKDLQDAKITTSITQHKGSLEGAQVPEKRSKANIERKEGGSNHV